MQKYQSMPSSRNLTLVGRTKTVWTSLPGTLKAALILAVVLIAFTYPFFFQGKQFSPMDLLYTFYPWQAVTPPGYENPSNSLRGDDATNYYPIRVNLVRRFRQDGLSFWQADHLAGTPNRPTINWYGQLLYPPVWLLLLLPFNTANSLIHILNLYIAGISMWLLLREFKLGQRPALLGAMVYMLNGYFVVWMSAYPLPGMLALLPLALFLYERLWRRRKVIYALMAALIISWQFYLGYPPGSILFLVFFGLYCLISLTSLYLRGEREVVARTLGLLALALTLSVGLSALYLLPTMQQLTSSSYMVSRRSGQTAMPLDLLMGFLFPDFWGNPTNAMGRVWQGWSNYCEAIAYWGLVPLAISVFGLLNRRKRESVYAFAILSLVLSLSLVYGLWPLKYLGRAPGFSQIVPLRWHFGVVLSGSMLSALGLEHLLAMDARSRIRSGAVTALVAALFALLVATAASPSAIEARLSAYPGLIRSHYWQIALAAVTLIMLAWYSLSRRWVSPTVFAGLMVGLTVVDLFAFGVDFNPYIADEELYPTTPGLRFLQSQEELYRLAPWGDFPGIFPSETANVYGIQTVIGHDHYRDQVYADFLEPLMSETSQANAQLFGFVRIDQNLAANRLVLDLLNTRYVATEPDQTDLVPFITVYQGPDMRIYENPSRLPRTWGVSRFEVVPNEQALRRIHTADLDARQVVLLEGQPPLDPDRPLCDPPELRSEILGYSSDRIVIQTDFACEGLLVISERFWPGWRATLDGRVTELFRADYALRAVAVPAGRHTVRLEYRSPIYLWGLGISLASLVLLCGVSGFLWKRWRGAAALGLIIPAIMVIGLGQPFKKSLPPAERWVEVDTPERPSLVPNSQRASLRDEQGEMLLLGYELDKTTVAPGESFRLTLYWEGKSPVAEDYTVLTHLLSEGQPLLAQQDQPPLQGAAPTTSWQEGQIVVDMYRLAVRPDALPGTAHMAVGMYHWQTGERVPLFDDRGNRQAYDWLILDTDIKIE